MFRAKSSRSEEEGRGRSRHRPEDEDKQVILYPGSGKGAPDNNEDEALGREQGSQADDTAEAETAAQADRPKKKARRSRRGGQRQKKRDARKKAREDAEREAGESQTNTRPVNVPKGPKLLSPAYQTQNWRQPQDKSFDHDRKSGRLSPPVPKPVDLREGPAQTAQQPTIGESPSTEVKPGAPIWRSPRLNDRPPKPFQGTPEDEEEMKKEFAKIQGLSSSIYSPTSHDDPVSPSLGVLAEAMEFPLTRTESLLEDRLGEDDGSQYSIDLPALTVPVHTGVEDHFVTGSTAAAPIRPILPTSEPEVVEASSATTVGRLGARQDNAASKAKSVACQTPKFQEPKESLVPPGRLALTNSAVAQTRNCACRSCGCGEPTPMLVAGQA